MRRSTLVGLLLVILSFALVIAGCTEGKEEAPVTTPAPDQETVAPTPQGISMTEAMRKAKEQVMYYSDYTLMNSIRYGVLKIENRVESVKSVKIASIERKSEDEKEYTFKVYGNFWGYDKYGRVVDNFNFECEVDVNKVDGFTFVHLANVTN